jgi:hypothetical protein
LRAFRGHNLSFEIQCLDEEGRVQPHHSCHKIAHVHPSYVSYSQEIEFLGSSK